MIMIATAHNIQDGLTGAGHSPVIYISSLVNGIAAVIYISQCVHESKFCYFPCANLRSPVWCSVLAWTACGTRAMNYAWISH